jgi:hypothetical protein
MAVLKQTSPTIGQDEDGGRERLGPHVIAGVLFSATVH